MRAMDTGKDKDIYYQKRYQGRLFFSDLGYKQSSIRGLLEIWESLTFLLERDRSKPRLGTSEVYSQILDVDKV